MLVWRVCAAGGRYRGAAPYGVANLWRSVGPGPTPTTWWHPTYHDAVAWIDGRRGWRVVHPGGRVTLPPPRARQLTLPLLLVVQSKGPDAAPPWRADDTPAPSARTAQPGP